MNKLVCPECNTEIKNCKICGESFEDGFTMICVDKEIHVCNKACLDRHFKDQHKIVKTYPVKGLGLIAKEGFK